MYIHIHIHENMYKNNSKFGCGLGARVNRVTGTGICRRQSAKMCAKKKTKTKNKEIVRGSSKRLHRAAGKCY